jgi:hypothetical protein
MSKKPTTTAIADAMKKAGVNTDVARLRTIAEQTLKMHDSNIASAVPKFAALLAKDHALLTAAALTDVDGVAARYLSRINFEIHESRRESGGQSPSQSLRETQSIAAGARPFPTKLDTAPTPGMPGASKKRAAKKHLTNAFTETLHNSQRRWGELNTSEYPKAMQQAVINGSKVTAKGHEYFADAWTLKQLNDHGVPVTPCATEEFVSLETLVKYRQKAHVLAAKTVAEGSAMLAQALQDALNNKRKQIPAA